MNCYHELHIDVLDASPSLSHSLFMIPCEIGIGVSIPILQMSKLRQMTTDKSHSY